MSEKWSDGAFAFLCAASVVIPLVGLITGSVCLKQEAKKTQAGWLLGISIVMSLVYLKMLSS